MGPGNEEAGGSEINTADEELGSYVVEEPDQQLGDSVVHYELGAATSAIVHAVESSTSFLGFT